MSGASSKTSPRSADRFGKLAASRGSAGASPSRSMFPVFRHLAGCGMGVSIGRFQSKCSRQWASSRSRIVQPEMCAARFGARVRRRRDQEADRQHVLKLPSRDGAGLAELVGIEGLVHHVAAPERDDLARLGQPLAACARCRRFATSRCAASSSRRRCPARSCAEAVILCSRFCGNVICVLLRRARAASLAGAAPKAKPFQQRIARQPIGAVQSRAARFADGVQTRQARLADLVRIHAADHVMRRGMNRDQILRQVDVELIAQLRQLRKALAEFLGRQMPHVEKHVREIRLADLLDDGPADDVARRQLGRPGDNRA